MNKKFFLVLLLLGGILSLPCFSSAQNNPSVMQADSTAAGNSSPEMDNSPPEPEAATGKVVAPLSRLEFFLSIIVLLFGFIIILLEMFLVKTNKISSDDTIKFITITLIITSTLFLITAGYSNDQIAPAVGLLGTIAGYLLGRIQHTNTKKNEDNT